MCSVEESAVSSLNYFFGREVTAFVLNSGHKIPFNCVSTLKHRKKALFLRAVLLFRSKKSYLRRQ